MMKTKFVLLSSLFYMGYIVSSAQTSSVGIGTTKPTNKLTVEGGVANPSVGASTTNKLLALKNNQGGSVVMSLSTVSGSDTLEYYYGVEPVNKQFDLYAKSSNESTNFLRYDFSSKATTLTAGNVGIGTFTPNHLLDLGATAGSSATDVNGKKLAIYNDATGNDFYGLGISSGLLQFHAASTASEAPGAVLRGNGNFGIGTTVPNNILDLGPSRGNNATDPAAKKLAVFNNAAGNDFYGLGADVQGYLQFHVGNAATTAPEMLLEYGGKLLLNTISNISSYEVPQMSIQTASSEGIHIRSTANDVNGILFMEKTGAANANDQFIFFAASGAGKGSVSANGPSGISYLTTSDIRLKENIAPTHYGIADLMDVQVRDYNYKTDKNTPQTGYIAQQLYTVFPIAVSPGGEDAANAPWMVDYGKITPLLTKVIQDQQREIEVLRNKTKSLRSSIANRSLQATHYKDIQRQVDALKSIIEKLHPSAMMEIASIK